MSVGNTINSSDWFSNQLYEINLKIELDKYQSPICCRYINKYTIKEKANGNISYEHAPYNKPLWRIGPYKKQLLSSDGSWLLDEFKLYMVTEANIGKIHA